MSFFFSPKAEKRDSIGGALELQHCFEHKKFLLISHWPNANANTHNIYMFNLIVQRLNRDELVEYMKREVYEW